MTHDLEARLREIVNRVPSYQRDDEDLMRFAHEVAALAAPAACEDCAELNRALIEEIEGYIELAEAAGFDQSGDVPEGRHEQIVATIKRLRATAPERSE